MAALLLSVIRSPFVAFDATTYVRVAYRHLAGEPVEFSGRVLVQALVCCMQHNVWLRTAVHLATAGRTMA
jgi:hypothetical protein